MPGVNALPLPTPLNQTDGLPVKISRRDGKTDSHHNGWAGKMTGTVTDRLASDRPARTRPPQGDAPMADRIVMLLAVMGGFLSLYATQAIGPELELSHGFSVAQISALLTATTLGLALTSPLSAPVIIRLGYRRTIVTGLTLLTLAAIGLALAGTYPAMLTTRALQGALIPFVLAALLASIEQHWAGEAAMSMSVAYVTGTILGGVVGRFLPGLSVATLGWTPGMLTLALVHALILIAIAIRFPADAVHPPQRKRSARQTNTAPQPRGLTIATTAGAGFMLLFTQAAIFTFIPFRLAAPPFGWDGPAIGVLYLVFLPALLFIGASRKIVARRGHAAALLTALGLSWLGQATTLLPASPAIVIGLMIVSTATFFAQAVLAHAVSINVAKTSQSAAGLYLFSYYVGGSLGALIPAFTWHRLGWSGTIALVVTLQLAVGLSLIAVERTDRKAASGVDGDAR